MSYRVLYTEEAAKRIERLDAPIKERIRKAILRLSERPEDLGKRLTGILADRWSYRVGDWRIIYKIRRAEVVILILTVGHRKDVYKT